MEHNNKELDQIYCRCGKQWGKHSEGAIYEKRISLVCVSCNKIIKDQCEHRYWERGNFCGECSGKCDVNIIYKKGLKNKKL